MTFLSRIFGRTDAARPYRALYDAIVAEARAPHWYAQGGVPDTIDGRFDMVTSVLTLVLLRLEREGDRLREPMARLAEVFVSDMDGQLRERGIGDLVVGKHIGRMMGQLGGRLTAYRAALAPGGEPGGEPGGDWMGALDRNLWRGAGVPAHAREHVRGALEAFRAGLDAAPADAILRGEIG